MQNDVGVQSSVSSNAGTDLSIIIVNDRYHKNAKQPTFEWSEDSTPVDDDDDNTDAIQAPVKLEKRYSPTTISAMELLDERVIPYDLIMRLLEKVCFEDQTYMPFSAAVLVFMPGLNEIRRLTEMLQAHRGFGNDMFRIYPLHSSISTEAQGAVFDIPPPGVRKIAIGTCVCISPDVSLHEPPSDKHRGDWYHYPRYHTCYRSVIRLFRVVSHCFDNLALKILASIER
jgi:hypothetical protein